MHIGRREFLASMGGLGIGLGLGAVSHWLPLAPPEVGPDWSPEREQFVPSTMKSTFRSSRSDARSVTRTTRRAGIRGCRH